MFLSCESGENIVAQERQESKENDGGAKHEYHNALALGQAERIQVTVWFIDPCTLNQLQVVEQGDDVVQNGESHESIMSSGCTAEEQVEFSEESGEGRNASQAEHRNRKGDAEVRILLGKSA